LQIVVVFLDLGILNNKEENRILDTASNYRLEGNISKEKAWEKLSKRISEEKPVRTLNISFFRIAASIALLITISLSILYFKGNIEVNSKSTEIINHKLPDGSMVTLNANSEISYNEYSWLLGRELELSGEAMFEVEKGSDFIVNTEIAKVKVLGTVFNVKNTSDRFEVSCFEGKVSVNAISKNSGIVLTQGLATALIDNELIQPYPFNKNAKIAWKEGLFYFEKESLSVVFNEIKRFYGVELNFNDSISNKKFSGVFNKGELENVLEIVCSSMGLDYNLKENSIIEIY
jgi:ferric-dicitrate binding protein FerR (iron transport regulator)